MKLLIVFLAVLCVCNAQDVTDCTILRVGTQGPPFAFPGTSELCGDLGEAQCCTADFLKNTTKSRARDAFITALTGELKKNSDKYKQFIDGLNNYFTGQFVQSLAGSFDISQFIPFDLFSNIQGFISSDLIPNLNITTDSTPFNIDSFVSDLFFRLSQSFSFGITLNSDTVSCIVNILTQNIDSSIQTLIDNSIQVIRQSYSILLRLQQFLKTLQVPDFTPIEGCVERLARLSYCGRCTQRIPPLCRGTCNNLVKGCLSPVYNAYQNDFRRIWQYVENILTNLKMRIIELFIEDGSILANVQNLFDTIQSECSIDFSFPGFGKRSPQTSDGPSDNDDTNALDTAFDELFDRLRGLEEFLQYDSDGPEFCEPKQDEMTYCNNQNRDPNDLRSCAVGDICVSQCNCWDGADISDQDTPTVSIGSSVEDQATNPAVDGLIDVLAGQAATLEQSSPVRAFLGSDEIAELNPMGVVIPSSGAARMIISITVMTLVIIVGLTI